MPVVARAVPVTVHTVAKGQAVVVFLYRTSPLPTATKTRQTATIAFDIGEGGRWRPR